MICWFIIKKFIGNSVPLFLSINEKVCVGRVTGSLYSYKTIFIKHKKLLTLTIQKEHNLKMFHYIYICI